MQKLGAELRFHSSLPPKLRELAIIMTGRAWNAQYEWYAHSRLAVQNGVSQSIVDAIAAGKRPAKLDADEAIVYNFCNELLKTKQVSDAAFHAAVNKLGERGVVDLTALVGYYHIVSMLLNIDRYPLPDGAKLRTEAAALGTRIRQPAPGTSTAAISIAPFDSVNLLRPESGAVNTNSVLRSVAAQHARERRLRRGDTIQQLAAFGHAHHFGRGGIAHPDRSFSVQADAVRDARRRDRDRPTARRFESDPSGATSNAVRRFAKFRRRSMCGRRA